MLQNLSPQPVDKIIELVQQFRDDPRADKIDLGVGVYKNAAGVTPVMRAVKAAEHRLWQSQTTKAYTAMAGDPAYLEAMKTLILNGAVDDGRIAAIATPGGTGAIRQALELIRRATPDATIWISDPTWPNHPSIIRYLGLKMAKYRYFDEATRDVNFAAMIDDLRAVKAGDVVLLHGCCHNPTGANLTLAQWETVTELLDGCGALPMIDIAYQGFGDGLDADAAALRMLVARLPETLIAASCSKNFGIYRERTGILMAIGETAASLPAIQSTLVFLNRQNYSFPPDHGARLDTMILNDAALRADWATELEDTRQTMLSLRTQLTAELRQRSNSDRFDFIAHHRGMFSRIGASPQQVAKMR
ncbi:MAG: aromatic amino acid transaminase, partial [Paracoccaceae bacterium]